MVPTKLYKGGLFATLVLALMSLGSPTSALAAPGGRTVSGIVKLPPRGARPAVPRRGQGFVRRARNPLRLPDGFDPRRGMVVVLEGGPVADVDRKPLSARYSIIGENFDSDILPVIVGGKVEIQNMGRRAPRLYSKSNSDIVPNDPINSKGVRVTQPIAKVHTPIDIRDQDSVHFLAHIVAFEHGYFSTLGHDGSFRIEGVPAGTWKIRVWYQDSWVAELPPVTVTISGKQAPKSVVVALPAKLASKGEAQ